MIFFFVGWEFGEGGEWVGVGWACGGKGGGRSLFKNISKSKS